MYAKPRTAPPRAAQGTAGVAKIGYPTRYTQDTLLDPTYPAMYEYTQDTLLDSQREEADIYTTADHDGGAPRQARSAAASSAQDVGQAETTDILGCAQ